jgi:hypothetical protein
MTDQTPDEEIATDPDPQEREHKHIGVDFPTANPTPDSLRAPDGSLYHQGGWRSPSDSLFPDFVVQRGGITFTAPKPLTKKQLRAQLDRLQPALARAQRENRKLRRKNRRLLKLIAKLA